MRENVSIQMFDSAQSVARAGADLFRDLANAHTKDKGRFTVALSGGSTPKLMFEVLSSASFVNEIDWKKVHFFWGDERSVPLDHVESNYRTARELLLSRVPLNPDFIYPMAAFDSGSDSARNYQVRIASVFGCDPNGEPPGFDLIYLGMGSDAHTASLFPMTGALIEKKQWVVRNEVPKLNTTRMTFTYPLINASKNVCFLVCGSDKADPLVHVLEGPANIDLYPSQGIQPGGALYWFLDGQAASNLKRKPING